MTANINQIVADAKKAEKELAAAIESLAVSKEELGAEIRGERLRLGLSQRKCECVLFKHGLEVSVSMCRIERPKSGNTHSVATLINALTILNDL
jgi:hypothetical protein